jgi:glycosyltransferase-like protein LARGE
VDLKKRTHLYYAGDAAQLDYDVVASDRYEVTLLVQTSLDRFAVLERVIANWPGPVVVVCHVTDEEAAALPTRVRQSATLKQRRGIAYHVVYKREVARVFA